MTDPRTRLFFSGKSPLVLASASPRRVALLRQVGAAFTVVDPGPDRDWPGAAEPRHGVRALALDKARRVARTRPRAVVLGADTIVVIRGQRLGKPRDRDEACDMLRKLQGRRHEVWTGIAAVSERDQRTASECTRVRFTRMLPAEIERYVATGEPLDKAGGYGIQGLGAAFVQEIEGDYFNIVGLPLARVRRLLAEFS